MYQGPSDYRVIYFAATKPEAKDFDMARQTINRETERTQALLAKGAFVEAFELFETLTPAQQAHVCMASQAIEEIDLFEYLVSRSVSRVTEIAEAALTMRGVETARRLTALLRPADRIQVIAELSDEHGEDFSAALVPTLSA